MSRQAPALGMYFRGYIGTRLPNDDEDNHRAFPVETLKLEVGAKDSEDSHLQLSTDIRPREGRAL